MKGYLAFAALLSAFASTAFAGAPQPDLGEKVCVYLGSVASSVASARDAGVGREEVIEKVEQLTAGDSIAEVTLYISIVNAVFVNADMDGPSVFSAVYQDCMKAEN